MIEALLLRLDAPLMSFGGPMVDAIGVTTRFPSKSMIAGLIGNALGYDHCEASALAALQVRIVLAARCDRPGRPFVDFQTVDLGQPSLDGTGWTSRGEVEDRAGGTASGGTHIRERHFIANAKYTLSVSLREPSHAPSLTEVEAAIESPARPLFIGRKCCLPSGPILAGRVQAASLIAALEDDMQNSAPSGSAEKVAAWWPPHDDPDRPFVREVYMSEARDWLNQIHTGRSRVREGWLTWRSST